MPPAKLAMSLPSIADASGRDEARGLPWLRQQEHAMSLRTVIAVVVVLIRWAIRMRRLRRQLISSPAQSHQSRFERTLRLDDHARCA